MSSIVEVLDKRKCFLSPLVCMAKVVEIKSDRYSKHTNNHKFLKSILNCQNISNETLLLIYVKWWRVRSITT